MAKKRATETEIKYAESCYCEKGMTPEAIAESTGRDIKTIYAWRDKYHWDETRDMFQVSPTELKKILLQEAVRIARGEVRKNEKGEEMKGIDADSLSKVMKAYDYISQKANPTVIRDIFIEFDNWFSSVDPKKAADMTQYHRMFLIYKIQQDNGSN